MADGGDTTERSKEPGGIKVTIERGEVKEMLRELLFEIPGFRTLVERGLKLPPSVIEVPREMTGDE